MTDNELDLHFAALTVLWVNCELRSFGCFRTLFAEHLTDVNGFTDRQVSDAVKLLDAGRIAMPSPLPWIAHHRSPKGMNLLDATVQVAVDLARRNAPAAQTGDQLWPFVERNLTGLRAPEGVLRFVRRALLERGVEAFTLDVSGRMAT